MCSPASLRGSPLSPLCWDGRHTSSPKSYCFSLCSCVCMGVVYMCTGVYKHSICLKMPEVLLWCLSQSLFHLFLETRSLNEPCAH